MPHEEEGPRNQQTEVHSQQRPFAMHCIDQRPRRSLRHDRDQAAKSQGITHTVRFPSARSKVGGQERPETCLHVCEKEVQPFDGPQALLFPLRRIPHRLSLRGPLLVYWLPSAWFPAFGVNYFANGWRTERGLFRGYLTCRNTRAIRVQSAGQNYEPDAQSIFLVL